MSSHIKSSCNKASGIHTHDIITHSTPFICPHPSAGMKSFTTLDEYDLAAPAVTRIALALVEADKRLASLEWRTRLLTSPEQQKQQQQQQLVLQQSIDSDGRPVTADTLQQRQQQSSRRDGDDDSSPNTALDSARSSTSIASASELLAKTRSLAEPYVLMWEAAAAWRKSAPSWRTSAISVLHAPSVKRTVDNALASVAKAISMFSEMGLDGCVVPAKTLEDELVAFVPQMDLLLLLNNSALQDRHWDELTRSLGVHSDRNALTLSAAVAQHMGDAASRRIVQGVVDKVSECAKCM